MAQRHLFLEATQLKTVCTATAVLRNEPAAVEAQIVGIVARRLRRPARSVAADLMQRTSGSHAAPTAVAEARGRGRSALQPGLPGEKICGENPDKTPGGRAERTHRVFGWKGLNRADRLRKTPQKGPLNRPCPILPPFGPDDRQLEGRNR